MELVAGANASEYPIDNTDLGGGRRHKGANLGQESDQGRLPQIRGLARHVRPGKDVNKFAGREMHVVGDEGLVARQLHNRVAPTH